jgi:NAD(P)-dependent dehydrogenase (short-subunit alcohol dehydrogenase family)
MSELRFDGRTVIVTGAGRGVGRSHALVLAQRGARVVVADIGAALDGAGSSSAPADEVVAEITASGGEAVACFADVSQEAGAASIIEAAMDSFGQIDVVVNNAGIAAPMDWIEDLTTADYRRMVEVHHLGTVYVTKAAWPHLTAARGNVVNTTSEGVLGMVPKNSSYGSAKGAVLGFTRALALDGLRHGIRVNAVVPRAMTRMSTPDVLAHVYDADAESFGTSSIPEFGADFVSPAAVYLAHQSCTLAGELLICGGGQVQRLALSESVGIADNQLTPEVVAERIDEILAMADAHVMTVGVITSLEEL